MQEMQACGNPCESRCIAAFANYEAIEVDAQLRSVQPGDLGMCSVRRLLSQSSDTRTRSMPSVP